ncbi:chemotaxis response regulator protein-glutamate methylesterase [Planosporangium flavigriseum]|uniref:Protein-glutamate methylesterase/protein-glutamine glutaminase n=1 Tax=Planosporangium flavigriseum TaxID=373681 RepID=A0A8J3M009_9ACTN|nr:chemotaxis response regulator protein-glutamate methylesterase [Planosporangium flavigriseum]NJC66389.1 chemotaxis response regulator protein-glutamate methylesterase [Planosporangium flavigriseum]GIG74205.1 chemotaxis response regulator protein-glutamate methylesterase 1 [Planosporangium flavigriseum]
MINVLVVDDSVVIRRLVTDALAEDPEIRVVGTAPNGRVALAKIEQLNPDLVTLDIEMPVLDGLSTLRELRPRYPRLPVIMFSTLTAAGASATLDALSAGASDYVTKPSNVGSFEESKRSVREQIIPRIHALCEGGSGRRPRRTSTDRPGGASSGFTFPPAVPGLAGVPRTGKQPATSTPAVRRSRTDLVDVLAVGCSTGGPDALSKVLQAMPASLPVPIVVVQHMPPVFTKMFAERLNRSCALEVVEAAGEEQLRPGTVYIAPGDFHLEVVRSGTAVMTKLQSGPPENFCRPAVDVLFRSVAQVYGGKVLATVLTGMGQDGKRGAEVLYAEGAEIVAQDEATSVVWGMPGAITQAGLTDAVLPLPDIANYLVSRISAGRRVRTQEVA